MKRLVFLIGVVARNLTNNDLTVKLGSPSPWRCGLPHRQQENAAASHSAKQAGLSRAAGKSKTPS